MDSRSPAGAQDGGRSGKRICKTIVDCTANRELREGRFWTLQSNCDHAGAVAQFAPRHSAWLEHVQLRAAW